LISFFVIIIVHRAGGNAKAPEISGKGKGMAPGCHTFPARLLFFLPVAEKGCYRETDIGMNHCISGHAKKLPEIQKRARQ